MKFFSKITFICNIGFVVFVVLGYIELDAKKSNIQDSILPLPFLSGTMVVLGQFAIFLNLIFCLVAGVLFFSKKLIKYSHIRFTTKSIHTSKNKIMYNVDH